MQIPSEPDIAATPCTCGHLESLATHSEMPIAYDAERKEFNIVAVAPHAQREMTLRIFHCFFCGGRVTPPVDDRQLVAFAEERQRLDGLLAGCVTLDDVRRTLGPPDEEWSRVTTIVTREDSQPATYQYRSLHYTRLSDSVSVYLSTETGDAKLRIVFGSK